MASYEIDTLNNLKVEIAWMRHSPEHYKRHDILVAEQQFNEMCERYGINVVEQVFFLLAPPIQ